MKVCILDAPAFNIYDAKPKFDLVAVNLKDDKTVLEHLERSEGDVHYMFSENLADNLLREPNVLEVKGRINDGNHTTPYVKIRESFNRNTYVTDLVEIDEIDSLLFYTKELILNEDNEIVKTNYFTRDDDVIYVRDVDIKQKIEFKRENTRILPWSYNKIGEVDSVKYLSYLDLSRDDHLEIPTNIRFNDRVSVSLRRQLEDITIGSYVEVGIVPIQDSKAMSRVSIGDVDLLTSKDGKYGYEFNGKFYEYPVEDLTKLVDLGYWIQEKKISFYVNHRLVGEITTIPNLPTSMLVENHNTDGGIGKTKLMNLTVYKDIKQVKHFIEVIG